MRVRIKNGDTKGIVNNESLLGMKREKIGYRNKKYFVRVCKR